MSKSKMADVYYNKSESHTIDITTDGYYDQDAVLSDLIEAANEALEFISNPENGATNYHLNVKLTAALKKAGVK
jgi:hypothetical protein